ncbi:hypothetical protein NHQ30_002504 [Ciborinia camelliae]|nr:hypothetical protein NHQ30_002504 [Ciborinia camelliae]
MPLNPESISKPKPILNMLLESIGLGRSHRDSRHALSRLSNHQGTTSGCYDIRHEKNGVHWEGCPNFNPNPRQLTTRDHLSMSRMRNSGRGIPRIGDPTSSMGLPLLQRNHSSPGERYFEGPGGMEALSMAGIGLRSKNMGQTPGGLEALRLGGQDPRVRNPNLDSPLPTGLERFEGLGNRRFQSSLGSDQYATFDHLMPRSSHRGHTNSSRQYPIEERHSNSQMHNPRYHDPYAPSSATQFQDLGPGPPEFIMPSDHHPAVYYNSHSPRPSHRSTPRIMYNEGIYNEGVRNPHPHHPSSLHQRSMSHTHSPNPLMYGDMIYPDSPLTSSRYGSIHSPVASSADLRREMGLERALMPFASRGLGLGLSHGHPTHAHEGTGSRNHLVARAGAGAGHVDENYSNYQSPYVEDWVSEVGMGMGGMGGVGVGVGVQDDMMQRQMAMEMDGGGGSGGGGGGFFFDDRAGVGIGIDGSGDGYTRPRLI